VVGDMLGGVGGKASVVFSIAGKVVEFVAASEEAEEVVFCEDVLLLIEKMSE